MDKIKTEALYTKIDRDIKTRAESYVYNSKLIKNIEANNMRKFIETSLVYYMRIHPIPTTQK